MKNEDLLQGGEEPKKKLDLAETWESYDAERLRRSLKITALEAKLDEARVELGDWCEMVVNHLNSVTRGRE